MTRTGSVRDDTGSALILALAFLALFGVVVGTILQFAGVGFRTTVTVHAAVVNRSAANGAVDGAVNYLARNVQVGVDPYSTGCYTLPASTLQPSVSVQCLARNGSGAGSTANLGTQPAQAVLTGTSNAAEGYVQPSGAATIQGAVAADNVVTVGAGSTLSVTSGGLVASTTCSTPATGVSPACQVGTVAGDPNYGPTMAGNGDILVSSTTVGLATAPACPANKVVTLTPGIYQSAAALNALTTGGACAGSLLWFKPGTYYLNFADAQDTWNLSDSTADVVGGTLSFALPAARPSTVPFPSAASPASSGCDVTRSGVVFIFGGDSRMNVTGSRVQLCAPPNTSHQQVALWGPTSGFTLAGTTVSQTIPPSAVGWSGKCAGSGDQVDPATGTVRHYAKVASQGNTCSLPFTPSNLTGLLPSDAQNIFLQVTVSGNQQGSGYTQMTYTPPGAGAPVTQIFTPNCSAGCNAEIASTSSLTFPVAQVSDLSSFSLLLGVVNNNQAPIQAWVDSPSVQLTYTEPLQPTSGVVAASGASGYAPANAATAAVLRSSGIGRLSIHGTVYAPLAAVDLSETTVVNDIIDRGIIARDVYLATTIGAAYTGPLISIPPVIQSPRLLSLTASVGGIASLRAEVRFTDSTGAANGGVPHVLSWSGQ